MGARAPPRLPLSPCKQADSPGVWLEHRDSRQARGARACKTAFSNSCRPPRCGRRPAPEFENLPSTRTLGTVPSPRSWESVPLARNPHPGFSKSLLGISGSRSFPRVAVEFGFSRPIVEILLIGVGPEKKIRTSLELCPLVFIFGMRRADPRRPGRESAESYAVKGRCYRPAAHPRGALSAPWDDSGAVSAPPTRRASWSRAYVAAPT